jgi:TM2 domain-containing membrane protein YozV
MRKDKNAAGILALFLGWLGAHRFYLGQPGLGILYLILSLTTISIWLGLIDAIVFFSMAEEAFDDKYNRTYFGQKEGRRGDTDFDRRSYEYRERRREKRDDRREYRRDRRYTDRPTTVQRKREAPKRPAARRPNKFKQSGIQKYKEYDYKGAIADFEKGLEVDPQDIALHFNLACAYSLEEKTQKSFYHLEKAVEFGFKDFDRIKEHEGLAFLRIQDEFETFEANGYRMIQVEALPEPAEEDLLSTQPDLLDQIKKLGELREQGLLTEKEFHEQKKKLLG